MAGLFESNGHDPDEAEAPAQALKEAEGSDRIRERLGYRIFESRSKGWRNGRQRLRRRSVDVELVNDRRTERWVSFHRFPFDVVAEEIYQVRANDIDERALTQALDDRLMEKLREE